MKTTTYDRIFFEHLDMLNRLNLVSYYLLLPKNKLMIFTFAKGRWDYHIKPVEIYEGV